MAENSEAERERHFVRKLLTWGRANRRPFPWRGEKDPFRVLVAEILLQRSRGTTVSAVYDQFFARWPDAAAVADASPEDIASVIRPLGLTQRAPSLRRLAQQIVELGSVPRDMDGLLALPGVGRYATSATLAALGKRSHTVDGTSARVYRRYFGLTAERDSLVDDELWALVDRASPRKATPEWNWAVLDLASAICLPKLPRCPDCPLRERCLVGRARIREAVSPIG